MSSAETSGTADCRASHLEAPWHQPCLRMGSRDWHPGSHASTPGRVAGDWAKGHCGSKKHTGPQEDPATWADWEILCLQTSQSLGRLTLLRQCSSEQ